jgi:hypothetical protein
VTLQAWQEALAELVISGGAATDVRQRSGLSKPEQAWLAALPTTPGFRLTCTVQRWWRQLAVAEGAPLVLSLLTASDQADLVTCYFAAHEAASLFPLTDALHFLEFVLDRPPSVPHIESVAAFELGLLRLTRAAALGQLPNRPPAALDPDQPVARHALAGLVRFSSPPTEVLGAILSGGRPPRQPSGRHWLLLAPHLPNYCRLASATEARVFQTLERRTSEQLEAFAALWACGALVPAGSSGDSEPS